MGTIMNIRRGGGATGCTLEVTGVKTGDTVLLQKGDKSYTKALDSGKKAMFRGLTGGTWTAKMSDGTQNVQREVKIIDNYELTMKFFAATISVTYPVGSTCTCTFSYEGETIKTYTAPDTSGSYTFTVSNAADWVVSCTNGTQTASKTVSITQDEQSESVALVYTLVLFDKDQGGDQTAATGGWNTTAGHIGFGGADATKVWAGATGYGGYTTTTKKAIDITPYSTLKAIGTMTCEGSGAWPSWGVTNGAVQSGSGNISNTSREYVIDVSNVTGAHTIYLSGNGKFASDRAWIGTVTFTYMALLL